MPKACHATGSQLATGPIAGATASKVIGELKNNMAGAVLDFGEHRWMVDFGPPPMAYAPKSTLKKAIRAFDPTSRFRNIKKRQGVRNEFLRAAEQLGCRVAEPST